MPASEKPRVIDTNDVLEVLEDAREPFLSTGEVTERLPASKPTVRKRLQSLEEEGLVRYRVLGANTPAWYLPELENRRIVEDTDEEPPDVLRDGGVTAGARWLQDRALVEPASAREWEVVEKVAQYLLSAGVLAVLGILGAFIVAGADNLLVVPGWVPVPSGAVTVVVGLVLWSVLIAFVAAVGYWVLLFINYYE